MRHSVTALLVFASIACRGTGSDADAPEQGAPNIVLILADDLGYGELGCYGQTKIRTPNIDRLAAGGLRFTHAYSGSAVCAPARSVLMTGQHTGHTPIRRNTGSYRRSRTFAEGQAPLPADARTVAELLDERGYRTAAIGKWGLGGPDNEGLPTEQGFDRFFGYLCQAQAHSYYPTHLWRDERSVELRNHEAKGHAELESVPEDPNYHRAYLEEDYAPYLFLEEALGFLQDAHEEPFFLYYASPIPHLALQIPDAELASYADAFEETPYLGDYGYLPHPTPRAAYAAMVTRLDTEVGRIVLELERLGVFDNTLILFTSDNGPTYMGGADSRFFESTAGLRGLKGSLYEGGLRVPLIAHLPGQVRVGESSHVVSFQDFLPTLVEFTGARQPNGEVDGISFLPTLLDRPMQRQHHSLYWELNNRQAVRAWPWKLVRTRRKGELEVELFHLGRDPGEEQDLAEKEPAKVRRLVDIARRSRRVDPLFPSPWDAETGRPHRRAGWQSDD